MNFDLEVLFLIYYEHLEVLFWNKLVRFELRVACDPYVSNPHDDILITYNLLKGSTKKP